MINTKQYISVFILVLLSSCTENLISRVDFMVGTWKMEGIDQYEVWEKTKNEDLKGHSYRIIDNQKIIIETLSITRVGNNIIYEATVPDQNEGKTIPFILDADNKETLSFENIKHDFPKKVQYKRINDDEIEVIVLGDKGKGFSYKQIKQEIN